MLVSYFKIFTVEYSTKPFQIFFPHLKGCVSTNFIPCPFRRMDNILEGNKT